jgi:hypothetical protein
MRWAGYTARTRRINAYNILIGEPQRKKPLDALMHRYMEGVHEIGLKNMVLMVRTGLK